MPRETADRLNVEDIGFTGESLNLEVTNNSQEPRTKNPSFIQGNNMTCLLLDPIGGVSGDMLLGALCDLGVDVNTISETLHTSGLENFNLSYQKEQDDGGMVYGKCHVETEEGKTHRHLHDIVKILDDADLSERVRKNAKSIFVRLAEAEAAVHDMDIESVHFHEVGAMDTIIDVLGTCIALDTLDVEKIFYTSFKTGFGTVECDHGVMPVPAPAVAELLKGFRVKPMQAEGEMTTPTGAAIVTTLAESSVNGIEGILRKNGTGCGQKKFDNLPNILRAQIFDTSRADEYIEMIETDIDDDTPEMVSMLKSTLWQYGACDITSFPVNMKKSRIGTRLNIACSPDKTTDLVNALFKNATTIGVRIGTFRRFTLKREEVDVDTSYGSVRAKKVYRPNGVETIPEADDCEKKAREHNVAPRLIYAEAHNWEKA